MIQENVFSLDLNYDRESLIRTACGSEFQTDGAEKWKARWKKSAVLMNGSSRGGGQMNVEGASADLGLDGQDETRSSYARRHNDLEGHSNFSGSFSILCLEHHYCGNQQWRILT